MVTATKIAQHFLSLWVNLIGQFKSQGGTSLMRSEFYRWAEPENLYFMHKVEPQDWESLAFWDGIFHPEERKTEKCSWFPLAGMQPYRHPLGVVQSWSDATVKLEGTLSLCCTNQVCGDDMVRAGWQMYFIYQFLMQTISNKLNLDYCSQYVFVPQVRQLIGSKPRCSELQAFQGKGRSREAVRFFNIRQSC